MVLRIHFTGADLLRTRLADGPDVLWETLLSVHLVQTKAARPAADGFARWRGTVRRRLTDGLPAPHARLLGELAPPTGYSADFLTPTAGAAELECAIDTVLATPRHRLRADIGRLAAARRPMTGQLARLADGDTGTLDALGRAMRTYHRLALAPYWRQVTEHIAADRATRVAALTAGGMERLLLGLHPAARWEPPVLSLPYPLSQDLHLEGRGLTLVPSFFCANEPITLLEPGAQPVLVHPVPHRAHWMDEGTRAPLVTLLGRTRAQVLHELAHGCGTGELARRIGVSEASASQHATVLRGAGLISTRRSGYTVHHSLTELGMALLNGTRPRPTG